jgi:hypothetical protein
MSNIEKLKEWADREAKENGLIDIKFFPIYNSNVDIKDIAADALALLEGTNGVNVTNWNF